MIDISLGRSCAPDAKRLQHVCKIVLNVGCKRLRCFEIRRRTELPFRRERSKQWRARETRARSVIKLYTAVFALTPQLVLVLHLHTNIVPSASFSPTKFVKRLTSALWVHHRYQPHRLEQILLVDTLITQRSTRPQIVG